MANKGASACLIVAIAVISAFASSPAGAQVDPAAELDPLAQASSDPADGLALARRQREAGDLLGAVATLERVMLMHPGAVEARIFHASLLCRLDDPDGARGELNRLAGLAISDEIWAEVTAACGDVPRAQLRSATDREASGR
jgi:Flp pilus assembly protein TadD